MINKMLILSIGEPYNAFVNTISEKWKIMTMNSLMKILIFRGENTKFVNHTLKTITTQEDGLDSLL